MRPRLEPVRGQMRASRHNLGGNTNNPPLGKRAKQLIFININQQATLNSLCLCLRFPKVPFVLPYHGRIEWHSAHGTNIPREHDTTAAIDEQSMREESINEAQLSRRKLRPEHTIGKFYLRTFSEHYHSNQPNATPTLTRAS